MSTFGSTAGGTAWTCVTVLESFGVCPGAVADAWGLDLREEYGDAVAPFDGPLLGATDPAGYAPPDATVPSWADGDGGGAGLDRPEATFEPTGDPSPDAVLDGADPDEIAAPSPTLRTSRTTADRSNRRPTEAPRATGTTTRTIERAAVTEAADPAREPSTRDATAAIAEALASTRSADDAFGNPAAGWDETAGGAAESGIEWVGGDDLASR